MRGVEGIKIAGASDRYLYFAQLRHGFYGGEAVRHALTRLGRILVDRLISTAMI
jgi:hypothetical protein